MRFRTIWLMFLGRVRARGGSRCSDVPIWVKQPDNSDSSVLIYDFRGSRPVTRLRKLLHRWDPDLWGHGSTQWGNIAAVTLAAFQTPLSFSALDTKLLADAWKPHLSQTSAPRTIQDRNRCRQIQLAEIDDNVSSLIKDFKQ